MFLLLCIFSSFPIFMFFLRCRLPAQRESGKTWDSDKAFWNHGIKKRNKNDPRRTFITLYFPPDEVTQVRVRQKRLSMKHKLVICHRQQFFSALVSEICQHDVGEGSASLRWRAPKQIFSNANESLSPVLTAFLYLCLPVTPARCFPHIFSFWYFYKRQL